MNDGASQSDANGHGSPGNSQLKRRKTDEEANDLLNTNQSRLMRMLEDPQFSDVTVLVGPQKEAFKLHRAVICLSSEFFKAACKPNFKEGITGEISLPEIDPEIFRMITRWQYEDGIGLIPEYGDITLQVQEAADFLQMPQLRIDLLQRIVTFTSTKHDRLTKSEKSGFYWFFVKFCALCRPSDLENTIQCYENISCYWSNQPTSLYDSLGKKRYNDIFLTSVIVSLERKKQRSY